MHLLQSRIEFLLFLTNLPNRKIHCDCQVKKYNFDMIEKFPVGSTSNGNLYCSLTCLASHSTHQVISAPALNPTTLAARIPSTNILISMHQAKFPGVFPSSLPVISAVSSLATPPLLPTQQQIPMQTQTVREV